MIYTIDLYLCLAAPLVVMLFFLQDKARLAGIFLLVGMSVCLLSAYINSYLATVTIFGMDDMAIYVTPISEECLKMAALLFYFLVFEPDRHDLLSAAILLGAGFATFENVSYLVAGSAYFFSLILVRGLAVGVMHIICALAAGAGLALVQGKETIAPIGILGIFSAVVTYHAIYNLLVSEPGISRTIGYALPLVTAVLIRLCMYTAHRHSYRSQPTSNEQLTE